MVTCEADPDAVRWGLHLLDGSYPFHSSGYFAGASQNEPVYYHDDFAREDQFSSHHSNVESDEVIAHALQEEFSRLAIAENSRSVHSGEEHQQASILAQDWLGPSVVHSSPDDEESDAHSSCSSPELNVYGEENNCNPLELTDEYSSLDGEVGKRLHQMIPIPHIPRINGEIPSVDEATSDHQRLLDRLQLYELIELKVQGDGNCQFRALSDQFYRTPEHHKFVRLQVVNQLKSCSDVYSGYVPMAYGEYIKKMSKDGEWGDHVTLQAASDWYGVKICVITSFKDTCFIEILPNVQKSKRVIFLSFWAEVHYNSIYPEGDPPVWETKQKRRWWHFGTKN